jgi:undecaprenyl-diphosphatase
MVEKIISIDKQLLVFLNGLGSENFDSFWLMVTKQFSWTPLFLLVFFILLKKIGWKQLGIVLVFVSLLILVSDQTANLVKYSTQRLRPCNDPQIMTVIRIVQDRDTFGFFSGHATSSMACAVFLFSLFKQHFKFPFLFFLFPFIFAYSRIYLGLHFPLDILTGYFFGIVYGLCFSAAYQSLRPKYFSFPV